MYIGVSTAKKETLGRSMTLEFDEMFSEIALKNEDGEFVGYVMHVQPDGCMAFEKAMDAVKNGGLKVTGEVGLGDVMIVSLESFAAPKTRYIRREIEGYGVLIPVTA